MGILKGALSARRYRVVGEPPSGARALWADTLTSHGYREPASAVRREETVGWVHAENLLNSDFTDMDRWLVEPYAHFALRMDKKVVPPALLKAHVTVAAERWCEEEGHSPCPRSVRTELRDQLEDDLLRRTLARPRTSEVVWNLSENWLLFQSFSERVNTIFARLFFQTFGLEVHPDNPLDWLDDPSLVRGLESTGATLHSTVAPAEDRPHVG